MSISSLPSRACLAVLMLFVVSSFAVAAADVQTMSGGALANGTYTYAKVTLGTVQNPDGSDTQYWYFWYFWVCDTATGKLVKSAKVARNPRAGSVSDNEASTIDGVQVNGNGIDITVTSPSGTPNGNELSNPDENPNVEPCEQQ